MEINTLKRKIKYLWLYLKYHKEIDELYSYAIKHSGDYGLGVNEEASFWERTHYWLKSE